MRARSGGDMKGAASANNTRLMLNGLDFAGPGALAAYLHEVLANDTLWRRYAARGPPPNATRASGRHWGGITLDRHVCDACLAFYG